jgi:hypothetical protein
VTWLSYDSMPVSNQNIFNKKEKYENIASNSTYSLNLIDFYFECPDNIDLDKLTIDDIDTNS